MSADTRPPTAPLSLWREFRRTRDPALRTRLLIATRPLVRLAARQVASRLPAWIERAELEAAGVPGLVAAVDTYDPDRNIPFLAYALHRIHGAILDSLRALDPLPRTLRRQVRNISQAIHTLQQQLLRSPDHGEIAAHLGLPLDTFEHIRSRIHTGLDRLRDTTPVDHSSANGRPILTAPQSHMLNPYDTLAHHESCSILNTLISHLPQMESKVLALHYRDQLTFQQIATRCHLSESRIQQLHAAAIQHIRFELRRRRIPLEDLRVPSPHPWPSVEVNLRD